MADAEGAVIAKEGAMVVTGFLTAMQASRDPGTTLKQWQSSASVWADKAEQYLIGNGAGMQLGERGQLRALIEMARDIADQSPKHVASLLTRLQEQLQGLTEGVKRPERPGMGFALKPIVVAVGVGVVIVVGFVAWLLGGKK